MKITNINWDTDGDKEIFDSLPQEVNIEDITPAGFCKEDYIYDGEFDKGGFFEDLADYLSEAYGYCMFDFSVDTEENEMEYDF